MVLHDLVGLWEMTYILVRKKCLVIFNYSFPLSLPSLSLSAHKQLTSPLDKMNCLKLCVSVFTQMPLEGHFDGVCV